jgi:serine/threonine-protein kinase
MDVVLGFENGRGFKLGSIQHEGNSITVAMASNGALSGPHACQQALGARENVVVQARSCDEIDQSTATYYNPTTQGWPRDPKWASDDAARLANAMLDKVRP